MGRRPAVLCGLVVALLAVAGADPAAAEGPSLTVTPRSIHGGDHVRLALTGVTPGSLMGAFTCETVDLPGSQPPEMGILMQRCLVTVIFSPPPPVDGVITLDYVPAEAWGSDPGDGTGPVLHRCGRSADDCAVVVYSLNDNAATPPVTISTVPSPLLAIPTTVLDGALWRVLVSGPADTQVDVAQCALPVGPTLAVSTCNAPVSVPLPAGLGETELQATGSVGTTLCGADGAIHCAVASFDATGALVASRDVSVIVPTPLHVEVVNGDGLFDGQELRVLVSGAGPIPLWVGQCAASVAETGDVDTGPCTEVQAATGTVFGSEQVEVRATARLRFTGADGTEVDCSVSADACVYAVESQAAENTSFATTPIAFPDRTIVTVSPVEGLLDGDFISVDGIGLRPGADYFAFVCKGAALEDVLVVGDLPCDPNTSGFGQADPATRRVGMDFPINQRFTDDRGTHQICREGCQVVLAEDQKDGTLLPVEVTEVAMARGQITAAPATGLRNGQQVTVTGTELMPSYDGPVVTVPSGRWVIVQCDAAVGDQPALVDVLRRCGPVDGAGSVPVTGPDLTVTVGVHTLIHRVLGGTTNCRTSPDACVLALTRQEQDGTVTIHTTPLAFR